MFLFRKFDDEDLDEVEAYLKKEEMDWDETLEKEEYELIEEQKYFHEIASNGIRYVINSKIYRRRHNFIKKIENGILC